MKRLHDLTPERREAIYNATCIAAAKIANTFDLDKADQQFLIGDICMRLRHLFLPNVTKNVDLASQASEERSFTK